MLDFQATSVLCSGQGISLRTGLGLPLFHQSQQGGNSIALSYSDAAYYYKREATALFQSFLLKENHRKRETRQNGFVCLETSELSPEYHFSSGEVQTGKRIVFLINFF
jgi:hypothetical protein